MTITDVTVSEIKDSRGRPTLAVTVHIGESSGTFEVPSGASTGSLEACELRDADGGVTQSMRNITEIIAPALRGKGALDQRGIDDLLISLDGTAQKTRLGGNALIGVSIAVAKAAAAARGMQVFEHLRTLADIAPSRTVPLLYMNYINGGKHAHSPIAFQEHMIVPDTESVAEALAMAEGIEKALGSIITERYGAAVMEGIGDEGGYVIPESSYEAPFELLTQAIRAAGHEGRVKIAIDAAATSFYGAGAYSVGSRAYSAEELSGIYQDLTARFPIVSIEDPFEEKAFGDFAELQQKVDAKIVGDDLTVTNQKMIAEAAEKGSIRAVIIKPNQIGTLTETLDAMSTARRAGVDCIVSHRSGETNDDFIADLAYAFGTWGLKAGALRRSERRVKYERLAAITAMNR